MRGNSLVAGLLSAGEVSILEFEPAVLRRQAMFNIGRMERARKRQRLTAKALAQRAGISPVTLSRVINGQQVPDEDTVDGLVRALGFPREFFFRDDAAPISADAASFRSLTRCRRESAMPSLRRPRVSATHALILSMAVASACHEPVTASYRCSHSQNASPMTCCTA